MNQFKLIYEFKGKRWDCILEGYTKEQIKSDFEEAHPLCKVIEVIEE